MKEVSEHTPPARNHHSDRLNNNSHRDQTEQEDGVSIRDVLEKKVSKIPGHVILLAAVGIAGLSLLLRMRKHGTTGKLLGSLVPPLISMGLMKKSPSNPDSSPA